MNLAEALQLFSPVSLLEMDKVKLMNRVDTKFVLDEDILSRVLKNISDNYFILEMEGKRQFPYQSLYFDSFDNVMYNAHHNGRINRYKIRFRKYITSNDTFLEIKQKVKGTRTIKNRILVNELENFLSNTSMEFIKEHTPFNPEFLESKIYTNFSRITLASKQLNERVTIDTNLVFYSNGTSNFKLNKCSIVELKRDATSGKSFLFDALNLYGIKPNGMSKYCLGRALTESGIKGNNFKPKIIKLNKIENGEFYYRSINPS